MEHIYTLGVCIIIAILASCEVETNEQDNNAMNEMVKNGATAIAARCAVKYSDNQVCSIYVSKLP